MPAPAGAPDTGTTMAASTRHLSPGLPVAGALGTFTAIVLAVRLDGSAGAWIAAGLTGIVALIAAIAPYLTDREGKGRPSGPSVRDATPRMSARPPNLRGDA
jgi:hypothetical protein